MDTRLIEALLIELLQLPASRLTQEKLLANLTLAATAGGLSLTTEGSTLQREHLQLAAALELLAADLGSQYRARAMLRLGTGVDGVELGAVIEPIDSTSQLPRFCTFGSTARAALARMNAEIRKAHQPHTKPAPPRLAGKVSLNRLAKQLEADQGPPREPGQQPTRTAPAPGTARADRRAALPHLRRPARACRPSAHPLLPAPQRRQLHPRPARTAHTAASDPHGRQLQG